MIVPRYTNRPQPRRAGVHFTGTGEIQDQSNSFKKVQLGAKNGHLELMPVLCFSFWTMMIIMLLMTRRSDPVQINTVHGGSLQTQHQAHHPPICLQVKIQPLILDSRISMNFEIKHGFYDSSLLYEHQDTLSCLISQHCRTHTHALGRVVSGWKVTKKNLLSDKKSFI